MTPSFLYRADGEQLYSSCEFHLCHHYAATTPKIWLSDVDVT